MSEPSDRSLPVLYRDAELLIVDKPAGLLVHRGWGTDADTALSRARRIAGSWVYPAHRLDRATSGVLVFALDPDTASRLAAAFREHAPRKTYLALVRGRPLEQALIDSPVPRSENGERVPAQTYYRRLGVSSVERCSLMLVEPRTGRLHQIRRHMKHVSHPLIGDVRYGKGPINRHYRAVFGLNRMALHATSIELLHPLTGLPLRIVAEPPAELVACWQALGFDPILWQSERIAAEAALLPAPVPGAGVELQPQEGAAGVDEIASTDCLTPEQHTKAHQIARGEGQIDLPEVDAPAHVGSDHGSELALTVGALDPALVMQRHLAPQRVGGAALQRVDQKPHSLVASSAYDLDLDGVE
jgi:tRNA pseudouridine65 synthase